MKLITIQDAIGGQPGEHLFIPLSQVSRFLAERAERPVFTLCRVLGCAVVEGDIGSQDPRFWLALLEPKTRDCLYEAASDEQRARLIELLPKYVERAAREVEVNPLLHGDRQDHVPQYDRSIYAAEDALIIAQAIREKLVTVPGSFGSDGPNVKAFYGGDPDEFKYLRDKLTRYLGAKRELPPDWVAQFVAEQDLGERERTLKRCTLVQYGDWKGLRCADIGALFREMAPVKKRLDTFFHDPSSDEAEVRRVRRKHLSGPVCFCVRAPDPKRRGSQFF